LLDAPASDPSELPEMHGLRLLSEDRMSSYTPNTKYIVRLETARIILAGLVSNTDIKEIPEKYGDMNSTQYFVKRALELADELIKEIYESEVD
jgi:hypothetical protein